LLAGKPSKDTIMFHSNYYRKAFHHAVFNDPCVSVLLGAQRAASFRIRVCDVQLRVASACAMCTFFSLFSFLIRNIPAFAKLQPVSVASHCASRAVLCGLVAGMQRACVVVQ
jgi:hypothetical protein